MKRATIYQVAEHAGVSHQTVSRYLRNNGVGMKHATLTRVEAAIDELNYRPNLLARSMRTRRTGRIAVLLPAATELLPLTLLSAVSAAAHQAGYAVDLVALEGSTAERAQRAEELATSGEFEGILALASLGSWTVDTPSTAVVEFADYDDELRGLGALADGAACGEVVAQLAELGHRRFLHLAGPQSFASARNRRQTFLDSMDLLGVTGDVIDGDWSGQFGYESVLGLPDNLGVTAIVAANDRVAMGAVRACLQRGWQVPADISVFGWDDYELGRFATPALSTVSIDRERQGREAVARLIALMRHSDPPVQSLSSLHTVIPRESSGPAPRRQQ